MVAAAGESTCVLCSLLPFGVCDWHTGKSSHGLTQALSPDKQGFVKPDTRTVKQLFELDVRYVVPLYQRPYVWNEERQWQPLWEDIEAILEHQLNGGSTDGFSHFLGAIVLEQELLAPGSIPRFIVIDGQQRLTTLQIVLAAASNVAEHVGIDKEAAILRRLIWNDELTAQGVDAYKVWPTNEDRDAFRAVMAVGGPPTDRGSDPNNQIDEVYAFFAETVRSWIEEGKNGNGEQEDRVRALRVALSDLVKVVSITLEPGDNAQIIFETLNARGTPLLALDLVKNAVFYAAEQQGLDTETLFYEEWKPELNQSYWRQERRQGRLFRPLADLFLMHWLTMKLREVVPANELFARFRQRVLGGADSPTADEIIRELRRDAGIMRSFESQPAGSVEAAFFQRLDLLDTSVVLPVVLLLFCEERVPAERRRRALRILESWLVRRVLMRLTPKNYNQQVPQMLAKIAADPEHADDALLEYLASGEGEISRWPTDAELINNLTAKPLYAWVAAKRIVMALVAVEQSLYETGIDIPEVPTTLTLEHIIPQSWEENWPLPTDVDPAEALTRREDHLHRLGNLTMVVGGLNAELSNAAWAAKRQKLNAKTKLLLNVELLQAYPEAFDEDAIDERGRLLAQRICALWPDPDGWRIGNVAPAGAAESVGPLEVDEVVESESERTEAGVDDQRATAGEVPLLERFTAALAQAVPGASVDIAHERGSGSRARLELTGATTVKFAYVDESLPGEVPLWLYPADTLEQARQLYADPGRCQGLLALRDRGWEIEPNFHWGFMARGLSWTRSRLSTDEYVEYWIKHIGSTSPLNRDDWQSELQRLVDDGIVDGDDLPQFEADFMNTERGSATPRPGLSLLRRWPLQALDDDDFPVQLSKALREALTSLGEPLLALADQPE